MAPQIPNQGRFWNSLVTGRGSAGGVVSCPSLEQKASKNKADVAGIVPLYRRDSARMGQLLLEMLRHG